MAKRDAPVIARRASAAISSLDSALSRILHPPRHSGSQSRCALRRSPVRLQIWSGSAALGLGSGRHGGQRQDRNGGSGRSRPAADGDRQHRPRQLERLAVYGRPKTLALQGYDPSPLRAILPRVNALIKASRASGLHIIHTRQGYRGDMADITPYASRSCRKSMSGRRTLSSTRPATAPYLHRFRACAARQGHHASVVHRLHTDVCVHTTLREACDRNFQSLTILDACASGDQYAHEAALHMVTVQFGVFGVLADSRTVLAALAKLRKSD